MVVLSFDSVQRVISMSLFSFFFLIYTYYTKRIKQCDYGNPIDVSIVNVYAMFLIIVLLKKCIFLF